MKTEAKTPAFLPQEAIESQRRGIIAYAIAANEADRAIVTPDTRAVYERYIVGEITLEQAVVIAMSVYQQPGRVAGS
jgi:hypothetical protein